MSDIMKFRELLDDGYMVTAMNIDPTGKAVICLTFMGIGNPIEGSIYYLVTDDEIIIKRAQERLLKR